MDDVSVVIFGIALASVVGMFVLLLKPRADRVTERLTQLGSESHSGPPGSLAGAKPAIPRLGASKIVENLKKQDSRARMRERILQAGLYRPHAMRMLVTLRMALCVVPLTVGLGLGSAGLISQSDGVLFGAIAGLFGTVAPNLWLDHLKRTRQVKIRRALPDALDVIIVCLEAGLSISAALSRVARELREAHPMLAIELAIVEREIQMGQTTGGAVRQFAQRFDLEELRSLAAVINQAEQFGTSVIKAFTIYADSMRVRRHQRAEELGQKASIKIMFPTLLCVFPGIFIVLLGPAAIRIYEVIIMGAKNGKLY